MEDLGIEITNADGSMKSWAEVVDQMRTGMQKLTAEKKALDGGKEICRFCDKWECQRCGLPEADGGDQ